MNSQILGYLIIPIITACECDADNPMYTDSDINIVATLIDCP